MKKSIINVALYGGSFDPPHKSHINLIKFLQKLPFVDQVWLLPCGDRQDKKLILSKQIRFKLMKQIFSKYPDIKVVDYQIQMCRKLGRMVHTYELLKQLTNQYKNHKFHFVIGGDLVKDLETWGNGKELKTEFDFIVFNRKGFEIVQSNFPLKYTICSDQLDQMSSSSIKKVLLDQTIPNIQKLSLIQKYIPEQAIQCLKIQHIL